MGTGEHTNQETKVLKNMGTRKPRCRGLYVMRNLGTKEHKPLSTSVPVSGSPRPNTSPFPVPTALSEPPPGTSGSNRVLDINSFDFSRHMMI